MQCFEERQDALQIEAPRGRTVGLEAAAVIRAAHSDAQVKLRGLFSFTSFI